MDALPEAYQLDVCWGELSEDQIKLVASFLQAHALKDPERARERARHTGALVYAPDGTICAQMSAEVRHIDQLFNKFWTGAAYVSPEHRQRGLPSHMNLALRDFFEARFRAGKDRDIIGWFLVMQSPVYKASRPEAVLRNSGGVFVGRNPAGDDLRVYYFEGAQLDDHDAPPPEVRSSRGVAGESAHIELCWDNSSPELQQEVAAFLQSEGALKEPEQARERARHTVAVARDVNGDLIAEFSAQAREVNQLGNRFWYVATYVSPSARSLDLARDMLLEVRDFFEMRFVRGLDPDVIGIFVAMQTRAYKGRRNLAVNQPSGLVFVGRNKRGDNMRVYYFKGARIDSSHQAGGVNSAS